MASEQPAPASPPSDHRWRFHREGGFTQVRLDRGADLVALRQLDQKLWVALACPVKGLEMDVKTLALLDTDGDGRIRVPEVIAAAEWIDRVLKSPDTLLKGGDAIDLADLDDSDPAGAAIRASARQILDNLGKPDAHRITLAEVSDTAKVFAGNRFNGDGIMPPDQIEDAALQALAKHVVETQGGVEDRVGTLGVDQAKLDGFFAEAKAYVDWWASAEGDAEKLPLGDETAAAAAAFEAVRAKVDDFFTRCQLVAFDPRSTEAMNGADTDWKGLSKGELTPGADEIAAFPIAHVGPGNPLPLEAGINPAWIERVKALQAKVVTPLLGARSALTPAEWAQIKARLAPFQAWTATKAGASVEGLGLETLRGYVAGDGQAEITALLAQDLALKPQADAIDQVEKIVRMQRDFHQLVENFVSFRRFYHQQEKSIFQTGVLYLDNRSCDLVMRVDDVAKHGALAGLSACYIAYLNCTRKGSGDKRAIAAVFSDGDVDFLRVGRNGVFYDRDGNDWDATITKVVVNPLSIRQAFWAPYKRVVRAIENQIEKGAAAREKASQAKLDAGTAKAKAAATPPPSGKPAAAAGKPAPFDIAKYAGIFAAIGLAAGMVLGALTMLFNGFMSLTWWQMPLAIIALMLVISGPSMLLAALKLRQRNLGPILEANGWAINARARINIPFGRSLTRMAHLPEGAEMVSVADPYGDEKSRWPLIRTLLIVWVAISLGWGLWSNLYPVIKGALGG